MAKKYPDDAIYNKLVRDRIPEIVEADGLAVETRILNDDEVISELLKKIIEESQELAEAKGNEETAIEMSDVLEILHSLSDRIGISMEDIEKLRQRRADKRGRFEKGIYLIRTYKEEK